MPELEIESDGSVWDLVAEFLERREQGEAVKVEEFVRSHPDIADQLRECLAGFQWMEATTKPGQLTGEEDLPRTFGNYELLRVIGHGGMGCVYEAIHGPLCRHVAVKVLPPHLTNVREFRLRFLREARVVASLHHTHITPVFEVGQIGSTLYLAMPFIKGPNLRELTLPPATDEPAVHAEVRSRMPEPFAGAHFRWVADIGVQAADALAHAHSRGVIHRDVKPSNLLIDEHGAVWIVDFGLAKAPTHPVVTQPGELIGTLRYASPEQIRGVPFDDRTDVYSLGVTLYELITQRAAFSPGPGIDLLSSEPIRPQQVNSRIPLDLETIVLKAMAKRPQDRYSSAATLADDLRRFLRDEPIRARRIGLAGRLVRWCRRNPALSAVTSASLCLLAALAVFDHFRLASQRDAARTANATAVERYADLLRERAEHTIDSGQPGRTQEALEMILAAARIRFRPEHWDLFIRAIDQIDIAPGTDLDLTGEIQTVALDPTGSELVGVGLSGKMEFWNTTTSKKWSCAGFKEPLSSVVWSPSGQILAGVSANHVWVGKPNRGSRALEDIRVVRYRPSSVAFSPNRQLITLGDSALALWDLSQGQFAWERPLQKSGPDDPSADLYHSLVWSPDGNVLATIKRMEPAIDLWSMPEGEPVWSLMIEGLGSATALPNPTIAAAVFSPDSKRIACACADGTIRILQGETEAETILRGHDGPVRWLAFAARGDWLVSADTHNVRLWDLERNLHPGVLIKSENSIRQCSMDSKGRLLATLDSSGIVKMWRLPDADLHQVIGPKRTRITSVATSRDNKWLAWADASGEVTLTDTERRMPPTVFDSGLRNVRLAFSPGGTTLAMAGEGNPSIKLRSATEGETKIIAPEAPSVAGIAFVGTGNRLAAAHADGNLVVWDLATGKPFATVPALPVSSLAASSSGKWLAAGSRSGDLHLINIATMARTFVAGAHESQIQKVLFSPDEHSVASAGEDGKICLWKVPGLARESSYQGPGGPISDLAFCLDGSTIASCGGDGRVVLWMGKQAERVAALNGRFVGRFDVLAATADGHRLIAAGGPKQSSASEPGGLEIWDITAIHRTAVEAGLPDWCDTADHTK